MAAELFDSHCHLDAEAYAADRDAVLERAHAAGVTRIVTIGAGYGVESAERAVKLAESRDWVWAAVGVHPHDAGKNADIQVLSRLARHSRVVAIGETGLDYHYNYASPEEQRSWFVRQIELAIAVQKPLVIHCREAAEECLEILTKHNAAAVGGVFHCYAENAAFAERLAAINFIVSFPGILTFKKSHATREAAAAIPLSRIMLETDGPFLAPEPHRGKRCESAQMVETAKALALAHNVTYETVARVTTENALRFFKIEEGRT